MSVQRLEQIVREDVLRRAYNAASNLHGLRLAKDSEDEDDDFVDLYEGVLHFEREFPFAECAALLRLGEPDA